MSPEKDQNQLKSMFIEIIGLEHGLVATIKELYNSPDKVVSSYFNSENNYLSPYKLLVIVFGGWALVNSFLIDWTVLLNSIYPFTYEQDSMMAFTMKATVFFLEKLVIPFHIVLIILSSFILERLTKENKYGFNRIMIILTYSVTMSSIPLVLVSIALLINNWIALATILVTAAIQIWGKRNLLHPSPLRFYFSPENVAFEKKSLKSILYSTLILMVIIVSTLEYYWHIIK